MLRSFGAYRSVIPICFDVCDMMPWAALVMNVKKVSPFKIQFAYYQRCFPYIPSNILYSYISYSLGFGNRIGIKFSPTKAERKSYCFTR